MAQPVFSAYVAYGYDKSTVEEYTPSQTAGETFVPGDLLALAANVVKKAGADPASIIGISEVDSEAARKITPNGKVPVRVLTEDVVVAMCSDTVPDEATHLMQKYGVVNNGGVWKVDTTDTTNTRVQVVRLSIPDGIWYVKFLAADLAESEIVS